MQEWVILIIAALVFLVFSIINANERRIINLKNKLKLQWGNLPKQEYTTNKFNSISFFYRQFARRNDVDDITWNDIDMDRIFMSINSTGSAIGEECLYKILRQPEFDDNELKERNRLIEFFGKNEEVRLNLQVIFSNLGKVKEISVYEYINRLKEAELDNTMKHIIMLSVLIIGIIIFIINPSVGVLLTIAVGLVNCYTYYKRKLAIDKYFTVVSYLLRMFNSVDEIEELNIKEISDYTKILKDKKKIFEGFRRGARLLAPSNASSGDIIEIMLDYFRMVTHVDLIKFNRMVKVFNEHISELNEIYECLGKIDAFIAVASYREFMKEYCLPKLVKGKKPYIKTENMYHPMLDNPVKCSLNESSCVLITGSNASGKSTFIKTMAINAILAQTIYTVMADSYEAVYFKTASSMALTDNIFNNESYYIVEIKTLKRILDGIEDDIPTLCFVDEVLRGTNTVERIAASSQILKSFSQKNSICFAATHDIELTYILEKYYSNYHFTEQVTENDIEFDYMLRKGRATSRNAIKLLGIIGYDKKIINEAAKMADSFTTNGEWQTI